MAINRLKYCSTQQGYSANVGDGVISQVLDGGADRYRRALKGVMHSVASRWVLKNGGYQYLMAFYRVWARNPNQPFIAKLCIDNAEVEDYECFFGGAPTLAEKNGNIFIITANLKVKPLTVNKAMDDLVVEFGNSGEDLALLVNPLEKLVNEDLPDALEGFNG